MELAKLFTVTTETLTKLITELIAELIGRTKLLIKLTGGMELKVQVKIQQPKELEVLFIAIHY